MIHTLNFLTGPIDTIWPFSLVIISTILIYIFRIKIRSSNLRNLIPLIILALMVIFEHGLFTNIFTVFEKPWLQTAHHLPLHLCSTSAIMIILYLIFKKDILIELVILQGIIGASITFLFPDTPSAPFTYDYIRFFLSHSLLFLTPIYFIIIEGKRMSKRVLTLSFILLHIIGVVALVFNLLFESHFMYISPDNSTNLFSFIPLHEAIPFFGNFPMIIVFGELLAIPIYLLVYYLVMKLQKKLD